MTEVFGRYAEWYDAFNRDKDYDAEATYVLGLVKRWIAAPRTWLDIGCGSGNHLARLHARGIDVAGVDTSASMIARARARIPDVPLHVGTVQDLGVSAPRDVVSALFHVMSYQTTDAMVAEALKGVADHLAESGIFVFDFWHSEAVLRDPPGPRTRQTIVDGRTLFRLARPVEDRAQRRIDIHFEFRWDSTDGELAHQEVHAMRHFSAAELGSFLNQAELVVLASEGWMRNRPLSRDDWYGVICAGK